MRSLQKRAAAVATITDKGLKYVETIPSLGMISLSGTKVSDAGIESLHRALPKCRIEK
jgi:hypothetical protein